MLFDGTDDELYRTNANLNADFPAKAATVDFAWSMWIKVVNPVTYNSFMGKGGAFSGVIDYATDIIGLGVTDSEATALALYPDVNDTMITWTHIVFSFAGADPTGTGTLWVSQGSFGSLANATSLIFTNVKDAYDSESQAFHLGAGGYGGGNYEGYIYQPIIFDRTLDAGEAEELYDNGIKGVN